MHYAAVSNLPTMAENRKK